MKVLILGANGFIGAPLLKRVMASGHEVRVLTRKEQTEYVEVLDVVRGDLTDAAMDYDNLVAGCDVIFNCAGEIRDPALMEALHVDATRNLLSAVIRHLTNDPGAVCHWVQLSSVGAYGPSRGRERIVTEDTPANPVGPYEVTKTIADELVVKAGSESRLTYSILRPSNVYGPGMPNSSLRQLASFIRRRVFFYVGPERAVATYIHVEDVVTALLLCGFGSNARGEIFNLSNDCYMDEMIEGMARELRVPKPFLRLPEKVVRVIVFAANKLAKLPVTQERVDALMVRTRYPHVKIQRYLGFEPVHSVPATIGHALSLNVSGAKLTDDR